MIFNTFEIQNNKILHSLEYHKIEKNQWTTFYQYSCANKKQINIKIVLKAEEAWFLDSNRKLQKIENQVYPPYPVGCLLVFLYKNTFYQLDLPKYPHIKFIRNIDGIEIVFKIKDIDTVGLYFWGRDKIKRSSLDIVFELRLYKINNLYDCKWIEPYPKGAKAAICLTDHADWDTTEKIKQLTDLFEKYNFKFTKSIFPHSDPEGFKQEPGLDDSLFKTQIDRLFNMGTEIAYHSFSPRINPPSFEACIDRMKLMQEYNPTTWIDHGTGNYLYSRQGKFENGILLTQVLEQQGIVNYWSYTDSWENEIFDLNIWSQRKSIISIVNVWYLLKEKKFFNFKQAAYIGVSILKNYFGGSYYRKLKQFWKSKIFFMLKSQKFALEKLHLNPSVIYNEFGETVLSKKNKIWIFDTILLNHLSLQLTPKAIDKLVEQNGLLLAHTYMGAQHKYGGSNCFESNTNEVQILKQFEENIKYISLLQEKNEIVSLSFKELRESYENFISKRLIRLNDSWTIENICIMPRTIGSG